MNLLCNLPCKGVQDVIASSQVPANLAQLQALELRSEAAAAKRNLHDNDETASDDIKVVIPFGVSVHFSEKQNLKKVRSFYEDSCVNLVSFKIVVLSIQIKTKSTTKNEITATGFLK